MDAASAGTGTVTRGEEILGVAPPPTRREQLAEFLRRRRELTSPESVGLTGGGRRRTPGLRREEISMLAGVGLSWYAWLEQGRDITPSPSVLDALARVLGLDPAEHKHLFDLAGVPVPTVTESYPTEAPAELRAIVAGLDPNPAYLLGPRTDVLGWNAAADRLLGTPADAPDGVPNLLWWAFTDPKDGSPARAATARTTLARFRTEHARRYGDPRFTSLIEALLAQSATFRELWRRHEVSDSQLGTKRMEHPALGTLVLHHLQSIPTSHPDLRLTQFVPADAATRRALARAAENGRQTS
jgi:transcriptional regulator with XRE-family HTH domain